MTKFSNELWSTYYQRSMDRIRSTLPIWESPSRTGLDGDKNCFGHRRPTSSRQYGPWIPAFYEYFQITNTSSILGNCPDENWTTGIFGRKRKLFQLVNFIIFIIQNNCLWKGRSFFFRLYQGSDQSSRYQVWTLGDQSDTHRCMEAMLEPR